MAASLLLVAAARHAQPAGEFISAERFPDSVAVSATDVTSRYPGQSPQRTTAHDNVPATVRWSGNERAQSIKRPQAARKLPGSLVVFRNDLGQGASMRRSVQRSGGGHHPAQLRGRAPPGLPAPQIDEISKKRTTASDGMINAYHQEINTDNHQLVAEFQNASWIWGGADPRPINAFRLFRPEFDLDQVPDMAEILVFAEF